jgi:hypothetical protein
MNRRSIPLPERVREDDLEGQRCRPETTESLWRTRPSGEPAGDGVLDRVEPGPAPEQLDRLLTEQLRFAVLGVADLFGRVRGGRLESVRPVRERADVRLHPGTDGPGQQVAVGAVRGCATAGFDREHRVRVAVHPVEVDQVSNVVVGSEPLD